MITSAATYSPFKLLHEGAAALGRAEAVGICIDVPYYERTTKKLEREIRYYKELFESSDLARQWKKVYRGNTNFESNDQLAKVLFDHMKIEAVRFTDKGNASTDEEALESLKIPEVEGIIKIRKLTKIKDTYLGGYLREHVNGIIHPSFKLHNVISFRSSSSDPNFQNVPNRDKEAKKLCRTGIIPRKGNLLLCADFKGAEVCSAAFYNKDPNLMVYLNDFSKDMHRDVGMDLFSLTLDEMKAFKPLRGVIKNGFTFPQFYGDWYKSCAEAMWQDVQEDQYRLASGIHVIDHLASKGIKTYQSFEDKVKKTEDIFWNKRFKVYRDWKEQWWNEYCDKGYFETLTGFFCRGVMDRKQAINYPIQGTAFHMLLMVLILLDRIQDERQWKSRIIAQIHDELVMDVHPDELEEVVEVINWLVEVKLKKIFPFINVPIVIEVEATDIDKPWCEKKEFKLVA